MTKWKQGVNKGAIWSYLGCMYLGLFQHGTVPKALQKSWIYECILC